MTVPEKRIYLASRSPRRRELLKQIGVAFELVLPRENSPRGADVDETPFAGETPVSYVTRITQAKAQSGSSHVNARRLLAHPVLAADTVVVLDGKIIGKPVDGQHAREILRELSGKAHEVLTAVALAHRSQMQTALSASTIEFRNLADDEIRRYVASGEPLDKAGAYAIQGRAAIFVRTMSGSYSGVMGLPLFETAQLLAACEITPI